MRVFSVNPVMHEGTLGGVGDRRLDPTPPKDFRIEIPFHGLPHSQERDPPQSSAIDRVGSRLGNVQEGNARLRPDFWNKPMDVIA